MSYPKYANTGKYNWMLGNPLMAKRSTFGNYPNPPDSPKGECCSSTQSDLHTAKAIVLECMDFRLRDNIACQLNSMGLKDDYDAVISAGASLGYNGFLEYNGWYIYIDEHVKLAYTLHDISEIIIIEHEECGAYSAEYPEIRTEEEMLTKHYENAVLCVNALWEKFNSTNGSVFPIPNLKITAYIISINGCKLTKLYQK